MPRGLILVRGATDNVLSFLKDVMRKTVISACLACGLLVLLGCTAEEPPAPDTVDSQANEASAGHEVRFALELGKDYPEDRLLRGLYESEGAWRWSARSFAFSLDVPDVEPPVYVELEFALSEILMKDLGDVTLTARLNGEEIGRETYADHGKRRFTKELPQRLLKSERVEVEFELDKAKQPNGPTDRELGLIAIAVALKGFDTTKDFVEGELSLAQRRYNEILSERDMRVSPEKHKELLRLFHDLPVWDAMWFLGHKIIKNPLDLWMMQQVMYDVRPDFVVETGTFQGGSALYWAHILDGLGLEDAKVLTVDIQDVNEEAAKEPLWKERVEFFLGSSTDPAIVNRIRERVRGKKVLVTLDSAHTRKHVLAELRLYGPMVSPGSYLVVEDTHYDAVPTHPERGPGPASAIRAFLKEPAGRLFEIDSSREAMIMTFNPGGWLRRKPE